jgi:hypothetical protein
LIDCSVYWRGGVLPPPVLPEPLEPLPLPLPEPLPLPVFPAPLPPPLLPAPPELSPPLLPRLDCFTWSSSERACSRCARTFGSVIAAHSSALFGADMLLADPVELDPLMPLLEDAPDVPLEPEVVPGVPTLDVPVSVLPLVEPLVPAVADVELPDVPLVPVALVPDWSPDVVPVRASTTSLPVPEDVPAGLAVFWSRVMSAPDADLPARRFRSFSVSLCVSTIASM